ncbi:MULTISPECIES: ATP-binding protein [unclassified Microcoleus]|uniref:ATP-binding protein n=1 Tax=unclassified Microcoleus TaxID=2642155 RepID=UPI0025E14E65|nr:MULTISPECIES: ATP-binding protein [unclassified Microcoleus]
MAINIASTKARLIGCSAVYAVGQCLSSALLGGPAAGMAAPMLGGPVGVFGVGVLATIAASIVGNITAGELGNKLAQRVGKNDDILKNGDLTAAVGEAISRLLEKVAESDEIIAIAERNNLPYPESDFKFLAKKTVDYWVKIDAATDSSAALHFTDDQLAKIFSPEPDRFVEVTGLTVRDWQDFLTDFAASEQKNLHPELIAEAAQKLHESFPKAFREVLKQDAETGGRQFAGMQLTLHRETVAELKNLGLQNGEVFQKLEALATREQICEVMARLSAIEIVIRAQLAQNRELMARFVDTAAPSLPIPLESETIIKDRIQDFTGRKFVFEAIRDFLQNNQKGYFVLEADPGVGKSSIMAALVLSLRRRCITHFNSRSDGIIEAKTFLENACLQLIQGCKLQNKYPQLPENATANGNFLGRLLGEASAKWGGKKLIFVVDALDEVDRTSQTKDSNVLYLPEVLPENVYFIVSKRRESLPMPVKHQVFNLMEYDAESLEDSQAYIAKRIANSASIQNWIVDHNLTQQDFVAAVAEQSQNNFMYLRYVLNDIESGEYGDIALQDLPRELTGYYGKHWMQMMGREDDPLLEMKVKIIYVVSKAREAVSRGWIAKSVGETDFQVQQVLRKWESFLRQQQVDGEIRYSIYHNSFRDFLAQDETVQSAGIDVEKLNRQGMDNRLKGAPL